MKPDIEDTNNLTISDASTDGMGSSLEQLDLIDVKNLTSVVLSRVSKPAVSADLNSSAADQFSEYTVGRDADSEECDCSNYDDAEDDYDDDSDE